MRLLARLLVRWTPKLCATLCVMFASGLSMAQGFSVGNFGIAAEVSREGRIFSRILVNPARLGPWLEELGKTRLKITSGSEIHADETLVWNRLEEDFPRFHARSSDPKLSGLEVEVEAFAPLGAGEGADENFLPVILIEVRLTNRSAGPLVASAGLELESSDLRAFGAAAPSAALDQSPLPSGESRSFQFIAGAFENEGHYAARYPTRESLIRHAFEEWETLRAGHAEVVELLPRLGDPVLDRALRSYVSASVLLTRGLRDGHVLTMGYSELNQRDSFWTSWIHLFFWPDLERRMIRESIEAQLPSGKIPTTILPLIERASDIDITEYFVLRVLRYYEWHRDRAFLAETWPAVRRALAYLQSLDSENVGLPRQVSYWADWKDVPGIEGRAYAPHFDWLYVAAITRAASTARELGETRDSAAFDAASARAIERIDRSTARGGLWNGRYYVEAFSDGTTGTSVLQDQVVGIFFGSMTHERAGSVLDSLLANETPWGVRETFPYRQGEFSQPYGGPGNYQNGGVWPWLCFVDATGRYLQGRGAEAERIMRKVAMADLGEAQSGDHTPNEFMNGDTGENLGEPIQGWDGAIFASAYVGAFGLNRVSDSVLRITPHLPERDFQTWLLLPGGGRARLSRTQGKLGIDHASSLPYSIEVGTE